MPIPIAAASVLAGSGGGKAGFAAAAPWLTAGAAAVGAAGSIAAGQAANEQAKFTATVQRQQAERERQEAASAEEDFRRDQSRLMAQRRAIGGASGVDIGTGSPLMVSEDFAGEVELQAQRLRSGGDLRATRLEQSAALSRSSGRSARRSSFFRAGASLLSGAGEAFA